MDQLAAPLPSAAQTQLSRRIDLLRFVLVAGLVLLHYGAYPDTGLSPFAGLQASPHPVAVFVNAFVLFFFLCAVPVLSAISGWLFFRNCEPGLAFFAGRLKARARSILMPTVLWNAAALAAFVVVYSVLEDPRVIAMAAYDVTELDLRDIVNALFGVTRRPIAYQLWFLHDLMLTVLVSPLLWFGLRFAPWLGGAALLGVWFLDYELPLFFRTDVLFFFYVGAWAQLHGVRVATPAPRLGLALLGIFTGLVALRAAGPYLIAEHAETGRVLFDYGTRLMRIVGAAAVWLCSVLLVDTRLGSALARHAPLAFFVYAAHWPLNQLFKYGLDFVVPAQSDLVLLANYALTGALTIATAILIARMLHALSPAAFDVLSGGRSRMWSLRGASSQRRRVGQQPVSRPAR